MTDIPGGIAATGIAAVAVEHHRIQTVSSESVLGLLASIPTGVDSHSADSAAARDQVGRLRLLGPGPSADRTLADVGDATMPGPASIKISYPNSSPTPTPTRCSWKATPPT